jgi:hypothetical protein
MQLEQLTVEPAAPPFPIYDDPVAELLRAHATETADRDPAAAHILGVLSGYAYADAATVAMMASRLGMAGSTCTRIAQTVDAMYVFSTAYLLQSRCGRVAILCYRGTEPANLGNWIGDTDVGSRTIDIGGTALSVHAGFYRNVRATRWPILQQLHSAANRLEALYVTGHSLGGAMAALFALGLAAHEEHRILSDKLRAVYTFGQPLTLGPLTAGALLPEAAAAVGRKSYRHIYARDVIPSVPPSVWGRLEHFGHEFHYAAGEWRRSDSVTAQMASFRNVAHSLASMFAPAKKRASAQYTMHDHGPHHYISALRPPGRITEFGDEG